jgi:hypothetical protein
MKINAKRLTMRAADLGYAPRFQASFSASRGFILDTGHISPPATIGYEIEHNVRLLQVAQQCQFPAGLR